MPVVQDCWVRKSACLREHQEGPGPCYECHSCHAQVCAGLFCWTGVLGLAGSCKGLLSEHLVRHRSDAVAAANSLGLKVGPRIKPCIISCQRRCWKFEL